MSTLAGFFRGSETRLGNFYPTNYILAVYRTYDEARLAARSLSSSGVAVEEVVAVPGSDLENLAQEHAEAKGIWTSLWVLVSQELSRVFATEEVYADKDLEMAHAGAGFLAVHCPTESKKQRIWKVLKATGPLAARHYGTAGIDHLHGET